MATRAETFRSETERTGRKKRVSKKKPKKKDWSRKSHHAAEKAVHAWEGGRPTEGSSKRPSRSSTRKSANRAKPDAPFNVTEETKRGAPENRARRAKTERVKVRGRAGKR
jgi:hypothetical protein